MCQQWLLKYKSCGHFDKDEERVYCEDFDSAFPDLCLRLFGPDIIRECAPGDGECCRCSGRRFLDAQWKRTISTEMDETRVAFVIARDCLFSFDFVTVLDLQRAQDLLTYVYLSQGIIMNVRMILKTFGYNNPELEAEFNIDNQHPWNMDPPPTPTLKYVSQYIPTPTLDSTVLFGTVVATPAQMPEEKLE